jgi:hypothetical protein
MTREILLLGGPKDKQVYLLDGPLADEHEIGFDDGSDNPPMPTYRVLPSGTEAEFVGFKGIE